jgi:hypothetical protein
MSVIVIGGDLRTRRRRSRGRVAFSGGARAGARAGKWLQRASVRSKDQRS